MVRKHQDVNPIQCYARDANHHTKMLLAKLLLLPSALATTVAASTLTLYISSVPHNQNAAPAPIPSPIPLAQISYDPHAATAELSSYTPPTGAYTPEHLLKLGILTPGPVKNGQEGEWHGILTSAASFDTQYKKTFTLWVDERGEVYHVGFSTSARANGGQGEADKDEVAVEVVKRSAGPVPALNRPVVLNAEGKLDGKEPEKSFLQKYWWAIGIFLLIQMIAGGAKE